MRGSFFSKGGTQSWPGTAIVNHPLRLQTGAGLSYFPYIFYFVNFTISAAIRQGLFGSFENVIKDFPNFGVFQKSSTFCVPRILCESWHEMVIFRGWGRWWEGGVWGSSLIVVSNSTFLENFWSRILQKFTKFHGFRHFRWSSKVLLVLVGEVASWDWVWTPKSGYLGVWLEVRFWVRWCVVVFR